VPINGSAPTVPRTLLLLRSTPPRSPLLPGTRSVLRCLSSSLTPARNLLDHAFTQGVTSYLFS
jgi:hypothetical protein